ncbi:MAG: hypothetical protein JOZ65_25270 [Chloroflexi bacterium]|nr:hypothetical protein [Chloroflexota bacterium]
MWRWLSTFALTAAGAMLASAASAQTPAAWDKWQHQVGIVDLGTRSDGSLAAMVAGRLFTVAPPTGAATPFAPGFSADPNAEPYFIVAPDLSPADNRCAWHAGDLYVLDLTSPLGIARVETSGAVSHLATLTGVDTLGGIALDTTGHFDHTLLVTGTHNGNQTTVFAVGCDGSTSVLTDAAPLVEGGLAVAPESFGQFAGDLIAPDENSGQIWAIDPAGAASLVIISGLPSGGDTGVESEAFVPSGFITSSGFAYLADRGTPDNPFPGSDSILRLSAMSLASAGVHDGDLLVATEGDGTTIAVRCQDTCTVVQAAQGPPGGHIEGHITFTQ